MHPNDPLYDVQWHFDFLGNIEKLWDEYSGAGINVGIYETGVESAHADLNDNYNASLNVDIGGGQISPEPVAATTTAPTLLAHGTSVAGLIAAEKNGSDTVGVAWGAKVTGVNIFDNANGIAAGLNQANFMLAAHKMATFDVVNNSWGLKPDYFASQGWQGSFDMPYIVELKFASDTGRGGLGTIIANSAGNDNLDVNGSARNASRYSITVAATDENGFAASYSNYGASILITAPAGDFSAQGGPRLTTTDITGLPGFNLGDTPTEASDYTDDFFGTSAATPLVSGVAALMLDANASLGWRDVQNILAASATHTGSDFGLVTPGHGDENNVWKFNGAKDWNGGGMHFSEDYGYGMLNAYNAVRMAEVWSLFEPVAQTSATGNERFTSTGTLNYTLALTDNGSSLFNIPASFFGGTDGLSNVEIEHVDLYVNLQHTDFKQLRISLLSPSGAEYVLYDGQSGSNATADTAFTWMYGIDALRGENANALWQVKINDTVAGETGTLNWLFFTAYGKAVSTDDVYHYTDEFLSMKSEAGQTGRGTLTDTGGTDWINAAAVTGNFVLNLVAGLFSAVNAVNWFQIAAGTTIENAVSGDGNDTLTGNTGVNKLYGMRGNDTLNGGDGADTLNGGVGNDTYVLGATTDTVVDTSGTDTITSTIARSLIGFAMIENLTVLAGASGIGNGLANRITGNAGANSLNGMALGDRMIGLAGADTYTVDHLLDIVDETGGGAGIDTVLSSINFSLANSAKLIGAVEKLTLTGVAKTATGNALANTLTGNGQANTLDGGANNDTLSGLGGVDTLIGNAGKDTMTGGAANDIFLFSNKAHSGLGANADIVKDFDDAGDDKINVAALYGPAMTYRHNLAFTAAGQVRINDIAGADVIVEVNTGGSLAADFSIRLTGTTLAMMAKADFVL